MQMKQLDATTPGPPGRSRGGREVSIGRAGNRRDWSGRYLGHGVGLLRENRFCLAAHARFSCRGRRRHYRADLRPQGLLPGTQTTRLVAHVSRSGRRGSLWGPPCRVPATRMAWHGGARDPAQARCEWESSSATRGESLAAISNGGRRREDGRCHAREYGGVDRAAG